MEQNLQVHSEDWSVFLGACSESLPDTQIIMLVFVVLSHI